MTSTEGSIQLGSSCGILWPQDCAAERIINNGNEESFDIFENKSEKSRKESLKNNLAGNPTLQSNQNKK